MSYQLLPNSEHVRRIEDGACIPSDPANRDWQEYQEWLAAGGDPLPPAQN